MKMVHVTIQTASFEKEIEFYQKYVGLSIQRDLREFGKDLVFLASAEGDTQIEIIRNEEAANTGNENLSIGFHADDLDVLHKTLTDDGLEPTPFISPMPAVKFFFVKDPAGVNVQFI